MKYESLKRLGEAPQSGYLLAYTREEVVFCKYDQDDNKPEKKLDEKELLELHLFDNDKEYRCVSSESKRFPSGVIEAVIEFPENDEKTVYSETVLLDKHYKQTAEKITVLNHIAYNEENGMAYVDNYRLKA